MIKHHFKKLVSVALSAVMLMGMSLTAFAAEPPQTQSILTELAKEYISVTVTDSETNYSNIENFYSAARQELSDVSDLDLAKTVLEYTNQDYSSLSDEIILETLDFSEITSIDQFFRTKEDGSVEELSSEEVQAILNNSITPLADWSSDDGYMKMTTNASKGKKTNYGTPFTLSCTATWLKYPVFRLTDTLAIVYGGTFDDSYTIYSTFNETGKCSKCGKTFNWNETESYGSDSSNSKPHFIKNSDMIELDFAQAQAIGARYDLKVISCVHPVGGTTANFADTTKISSYIRFRVLCGSTTEARAAYAHTKLAGKVTISGSVSASGVSPSFGGTLDIIASKYTAAPVTLRCN